MEMLDIYEWDSTWHLTAKSESRTEGCLQMDFADMDICRRHAIRDAIVVPTTFKGNRIMSNINAAVFNA